MARSAQLTVAAAVLTDTILIDQLQVVDELSCVLAGQTFVRWCTQMGELQLSPAAVDTQKMLSQVLHDCIDIVRSTPIQAGGCGRARMR